MAASPRPAAESESPPDAPAGGPSVDTATLYRLVVERLRQLSPAGVVNPRLVWEIPGNAVAGSIPLDVPLPVLGELAADLLAALKRVAAGEWVSGPQLAILADDSGDLDPTSGSFKRAVEDVKAAVPVETGRKGYRLKQ